MTDTVTKEFWVFETNLVWTLFLLSHIAKYDIGSSDLEAVKYDLTATSQEKDLWTTYQLIGTEKIDLRLAREEDNTDIIFIKVSFDKKLLSQIDFCIFIVQDFYLDHRFRHTDLNIYE
jgi:hypothetical protein